jgi:AcrR family transcriptional regulator
MATKDAAPENSAQRIMRVAREIIRESGAFDLPMRQLATRAQVSLRTPYELFGSKTGIIRAILKQDEANFGRLIRATRSANRFDSFFQANKAGIAFFASNQPFYRALYQATQAYSGGEETDPAREENAGVRRFAVKAIKAGLIDPAVDPHVLYETLMDIFAANLRAWAASSFDIQLVEYRIGFGQALVLAALARPPHDAALRRRAADFQRKILALTEPQAQGAARVTACR